MPWNLNGDTGATHPSIMRVRAIPGADRRSTNEVAGFFWRLTMLSSQHLSDHIIDAGTVDMIMATDEGRVLQLAIRSGLLTKIKDPFDPRLPAYKLLDDPDLVDIRTRAEIEWTRQQRADTSNPALAVPVRMRDGDQCRYCRVVVWWGPGRPGARKGTLDHTQPGQAATVDTMVVACMACNGGLRDNAGKQRAEPNPPPAAPFYSKGTAQWLTENGHPTMPTTSERPGSQPDTAHEGDPAASRTPPPVDSDPASRRTPRNGTAPRRATSPRPRDNSPPNSISGELPSHSEMNMGGKGRAGSGSAFGFNAATPAKRTRKRSARGNAARAKGAT